MVQTYSIPYPSATGSTENARDIVSTSPGEVLVYNGTFDPYLTTLDTSTDTWAHKTYPGWSTVNNGTYGGIAASEKYVFVTDMRTFGGGGDEASGVIRFDRLNGTADRFASNIEPIDLTLGLDGLLYVLYPGGSPSGRFIDVFDPETLVFIRTISLADIFGHTAHRAVAVNENGDLFIADWDGDLQKLDSIGNVLIETNVCGIAATCSLYDIDVSEDGRVVMGDRFGGVTIIDENFSSFSRFNVGTRGTFVGFVPFALIPPKIHFDGALNPQGCIEATGPNGALVSLWGENRNDQPVSYAWHASTGEYGSDVSFSLNIAVNEEVVVTLEITDEQTGDKSTSSVSMCVSDTTPPVVEILSPMNGESFTGNNIKLDVVINDLVDTEINSYEVFAGKSFVAPYDGESAKVRINLFKPGKKLVHNMELRVVAEDFSGNKTTEAVNVEILHDRRRRRF